MASPFLYQIVSDPSEVSDSLMVSRRGLRVKPDEAGSEKEKAGSEKEKPGIDK
jgi:hypothetical protein